MADKLALATELYTTLNSTSNATATEKQKLRDRYVLLYPNHWTNFLADNALSDTAANRLRFVAWMMVNDYLRKNYIAGSEREITAAQPAADDL